MHTYVFIRLPLDGRWTCQLDTVPSTPDGLRWGRELELELEPGIIFNHSRAVILHEVRYLSLAR